MKSLKKILALVLALVLALSVVACGKPADTPVVDEPSTETETPSTETEEVKEEEPFTIIISVGAGAGAQEGWEAVEKAYEALHPNADIIVDLKPGDGYAEWARTVAADYTANGAPDILTINQIPPEYRDEGEVINWEEYMYDVNPYDKEGKLWKECINYELQSKSAIDNSFDCLNLCSLQVCWFYNADIFKEVGVEAPENWDEFVEVCEKIYDAGYQPISIEGDYNSFYAWRMGWLSRMFTDQAYRWIQNVRRSQPGDYTYDPDKDDKWAFDPTNPFNDYSDYVTTNPVRQWAALYDGTISADTEGNKAVWENFKKVFPKYAGGDAFFGCTDAYSAFYQGKAAMMVDISNFAITYQNNIKKMQAGEEVVVSGEEALEGIQVFELGTFRQPSMTNESGKYGPDELFQAPARTLEGPNGFLGAFNKNAEQTAHVVDFLMFYTSAEGHTIYMNEYLANGGVPAGPALVYGVEYPEEIAAAFESNEFYGDVKCCLVSRGLADQPESTRAYYDLACQVLQDKITVDEYVEKMAAQHLQYFEQALPADISISDFANPANEPTGQDG
ncbi:MAG: extracellular solute-binding protein [Oscillospiraceae bacterium]|nr:extracellular solute-binding protein [Oscillospiraceae bacterium]